MSQYLLLLMISPMVQHTIHLLSMEWMIIALHNNITLYYIRFDWVRELCASQANLVRNSLETPAIEELPV